MGGVEKHNMLQILSVLCFGVYVNVILAADYVPTDFILLNCGALSRQTADIDGRNWVTDTGSKFVLSTTGSSTASAATQTSSVDKVPFMTARIFTSKFTYSFPVSPGRKFVRLYFYPNTYSGLDATNAIFSVTSGAYTLLSNFNAGQTTRALNVDFLIKEYSINVEGENAVVSLTFTPSSNSFAFVNGIEIVSMPDVYANPNITLSLVGGGNFLIDNTTALEKMYRLNVGGSYIPPTSDTGLHRSWHDDTPYIFGTETGFTSQKDDNVTFKYPDSIPSYTAPVEVYSTSRWMGPDNQVNLKSNLTWLFTVDNGFLYLVRLHFCELFFDINKVNQVVFNIYLNKQTADTEVDIVALAGSNGIPYVKDYVVILPMSNDPQQDLWLDLHPDPTDKPMFYTSFLNGLEIFKLNNPDGNLAGPNPIPAPK